MKKMAAVLLFLLSISSSCFAYFKFDPMRWESFSASSSGNVFLYDKQTVRHFKEFGENKTEVWVVTACPEDKRYLRVFYVFNDNKRSYVTYDTDLLEYNTLNILNSSNNRGLYEKRVNPDSIVEHLYNIVVLGKK